MSVSMNKVIHLRRIKNVLQLISHRSLAKRIGRNLRDSDAPWLISENVIFSLKRILMTRRCIMSLFEVAQLSVVPHLLGQRTSLNKYQIQLFFPKVWYSHTDLPFVYLRSFYWIIVLYNRWRFKTFQQLPFIYLFFLMSETIYCIHYQGTGKFWM